MNITIERGEERMDGTAPLKLVLFKSPERARYTIPDVRVTATQWDGSKGRVRFGVTNSALMNERIAKTFERAQRIVLERQGITPTELREALKVPDRSSNVLLSDAMQAAFEEHQHRWRYGTKKGRMTVIRDVRMVLPTCTLDGFGRSELMDIDRWYVGNGLMDNTRRSRLRRLSTMYGFACALFDIPPKVKPSKIAPPEVRTMKVFLSLEQVEVLRSASNDLPAPMRLAVHAWLLQFDLGGLRFNEVCRLTVAMRTRDAFRWVEGKVPKPRYHPINAKAQAIIDHYAGGQRILPLVGEGLTGDAFDRAVEAANTITNRQLQQACKLVGLPRVTTHNARHSAAQRIKEATDIHTASRILGHATVKQTEAYLNELDTTVVDEAFAKLA